MPMPNSLPTQLRAVIVGLSLTVSLPAICQNQVIDAERPVVVTYNACPGVAFEMRGVSRNHCQDFIVWHQRLGTELAARFDKDFAPSLGGAGKHYCKLSYGIENGKIVNCKLLESSGYLTFNSGLLASLKSLEDGPFLTLPAKSKRHSISETVSVNIDLGSPVAANETIKMPICTVIDIDQLPTPLKKMDISQPT